MVVNITPSTQRLLAELMRYYQKLVPSSAPPLSGGWWSDLRRRGFGGPRYVIVGDHHDPPDFMRQPELSKIVYRERPDDEEELIRRADLLMAKRIVLIADQHDSAPDAETIRTLLTLVERLRDRERHGEQALGRRRVVIAEILDESNVAAAQAALATGDRSFRGFVVPTEKLLALFFASVVRRPGLGHLLEELLTSKGHEIYTCFFDTDGLGFALDRPPDLGASAPVAMDRLLHQGMLGGDTQKRVVPLGLLSGRPRAPGGRDFDVFINPTGTPEEMGGCAGSWGSPTTSGRSGVWPGSSTKIRTHPVRACRTRPKCPRWSGRTAARPRTCSCVASGPGRSTCSRSCSAATRAASCSWWSRTRRRRRRPSTPSRCTVPSCSAT